MGITTIERLCQAFQQTLANLGYPESEIRHYQRQRLGGEWDQVFEVTEHEIERLLAVIGMHTASASLQSYAASLSYTQDNGCVLLSKSPNQGIQGFLFSRAAEGLAFYQIKYTSRSTCLISDIAQFPSFEKLKRRYKLKMLYKNVASYAGKVLYRNTQDDGQKYYQRLDKKRG